MTDKTIIQATLLYEATPTLPQDSLRTDLRIIALKHGLPNAGASDVRAGRLRLTCLPFEIVVEVSEAALTASHFTGAISGNLRPGQRAPLARIVTDHTAYAKVSIRDTGLSHGVKEVILSEDLTRRQNMRRATTFAQDVVRMVLRHMPATAVHWRPSNQLVQPGGLEGQDFGQLYLPLCLRLKCTSAILQDTDVVNMAQEVVGAEDFLGRPLHIMALSLNRFETMQLAVAFLDRMLLGDARPISGAIFRDKRGKRVEVVEHPACERMPNGLIALVEVDEVSRKSHAPVSETVVNARAQIADREHARVKSRPLAMSGTRSRPVLNEEQMATVHAGLAASERGFVRPPDTVTAPVLSADQLRAIRDRAARRD